MVIIIINKIIFRVDGTKNENIEEDGKSEQAQLIRENKKTKL